jgi:hypothetical protein
MTGGEGACGALRHSASPVPAEQQIRSQTEPGHRHWRLPGNADSELQSTGIRISGQALRLCGMGHLSHSLSSRPSTKGTQGVALTQGTADLASQPGASSLR